MLSVPTLEKNQGNRLLCLSFFYFSFFGPRRESAGVGGVGWK